MSELFQKLEVMKKENNQANSNTVKSKTNFQPKSSDLPSLSVLRQEFKIQGQIGEPGQTDKLTFVSLTHQIDSGLKRGYKEGKITDARKLTATSIMECNSSRKLF